MMGGTLVASIVQLAVGVAEVFPLWQVLQSGETVDQIAAGHAPWSTLPLKATDCRTWASFSAVLLFAFGSMYTAVLHNALPGKVQFAYVAKLAVGVLTLLLTQRRLIQSYGWAFALNDIVSSLVGLFLLPKTVLVSSLLIVLPFGAGLLIDAESLIRTFAQVFHEVGLEGPPQLISTTEEWLFVAIVIRSGAGVSHLVSALVGDSDSRRLSGKFMLATGAIFFSFSHIFLSREISFFYGIAYAFAGLLVMLFVPATTKHDKTKTQ